MAGEEKPPKETFRARVVNVGGNLPSGTGLMWMTVESWSTDQEREALLRGLQARRNGIVRTLTEGPGSRKRDVSPKLSDRIAMAGSYGRTGRRVPQIKRNRPDG